MHPFTEESFQVEDEADNFGKKITAWPMRLDPDNIQHKLNQLDQIHAGDSFFILSTNQLKWKGGAGKSKLFVSNELMFEMIRQNPGYSCSCNLI